MSPRNPSIPVDVPNWPSRPRPLNLRRPRNTRNTLSSRSPLDFRGPAHPRPAARTVALTLAAGLALAGCAGTGGGTSAVADPVGAHPVVAGGQAQGVLDRVQAAAGAAAKAPDPASLGPRVVGPEQTVLAAGLKLPAAQRPAGPAADVAWQRLLVPSRSGWPRWFVAAGTATGRTTPVLWVLSSQDARTPYGLWGELLMLPGAQLPEVAKAGVGAPELPPDATGLLVSPKDVAARYADLLANGNASPYAKTFAQDAFRDQVLRRLAGDRVQLQQLQGTATDEHAVQGQPLALRTADGGALVIVALTETYTAKVSSSAGSVKVNDPLVAALAGTGSFSNQLVQTSAELVAFTVPPASAGGLVQVIAAAKGHVSAAAS
ncbi:MAG TPA: hypothetical protein VFP72_00920 [Kineosporiaceae bacterium]|nr:hypothetical protein [Kineosporiaceae bacterium]